jgi:hypothetical protein
VRHVGTEDDSINLAPAVVHLRNERTTVVILEFDGVIGVAQLDIHLHRDVGKVRFGFSHEPRQVLICDTYAMHTKGLVSDALELFVQCCVLDWVHQDDQSSLIRHRLLEAPLEKPQ